MQFQSFLLIMNKIKLFILLTVSILGSLPTHSQDKPVLDTGPSSVQWHQLHTSYFQVIYPESYREEANRVANVLEAVYEPVGISLGKYPKKTKIVVRNQNSISNAFVAWAPRRSEFNTMSSHDYNFLGVNDWMELIAVHEFRHVVQQEKSLTGFNKFLYYVFGQAAVGSMGQMAVPLWFWEGDAVCIETALTPTGRGRIPAFNMAMRANLLEKGVFNYNKQYLTSFKDFVPNHYVTGYHFTSWLRDQYGGDILHGLTKNAWGWSFVPFTFSNAMNGQTGDFLVKNYKKFIRDLRQRWVQQQENQYRTDYDPINVVEDQTFTNYQYPTLLEDGRMLTMKSGIGDIQTIVTIDENGNETTIAQPGLFKEGGMLSANDRYAVWTEIEPDPRWPARNYAVLKLLNISTGKIDKISHKSRFSAAAISQADDRIVAVEEEVNGDVSIVIMNNSGKETSRFNMGNDVFYHMPSWSADGKKVIVLKTIDRNRYVVSIDPESGREDILIDAGSENIGYPRKFGDLLFYNSPYTGIDNIFIKDLSSGNHYQMTHAKYGAFNPFYDDMSNTVYFNDYQVEGHNVVSKKLDMSTLDPIKKDDPHELYYARVNTGQESANKVLETTPEFDYPYEDYNKLSHIINPHSWGITLATLDPEFRIFARSKDILSTTTIGAGYNYNANERTGRWEVNISYQNFYPIFDLSFSDGRRSVTEQFMNPDNANQNINTSIEWQERGVDLGIRVPLNLTRSKYRQRLQVEAVGSYKAVDEYFYPHQPQDLIQGGDLIAADINLEYERLLKRSKRDINSRFGQQVSLHYKSTPFGGDFQSALLAAEGALYLPGVFKHHSFWLRGAYQYEDKTNYVFESPVTFPRGYAYASYENLFIASVNYALPLWYPDIALGPVINFQRVKVNLFYDYGYGYNYTNILLFFGERYYHSVGAELSFDVNFMRFLPLFDIGIRYSYKPVEEEASIGLLIGSVGF